MAMIAKGDTDIKIVRLNSMPSKRSPKYNPLLNCISNYWLRHITSISTYAKLRRSKRPDITPFRRLRAPMAERFGGDLLERLGPDLSAAVFLCLDDPRDLVRSASVSRSWRRFVIENGFCKMLCLRMSPEISCFVRAVEVGVSSVNMEVGPNFSVQCHLESEHRIYAFLGDCIVSPKFLARCTFEAIAISSTAHRTMNKISNCVGPNFSSYSSSQGHDLTFKLNARFSVLHEIIIHPGVVFFDNGTLVHKPKALRFRLGHMRDEKAKYEESLDRNYIWTYISPEFSIEHEANDLSIKLPRPVICISGVLQIEVLTGVAKSSSDELPFIRLLVQWTFQNVTFCKNQFGPVWISHTLLDLGRCLYFFI